MDNQRNETLQSLCRNYLRKLKYMAKKHGLENWINNIINDNKSGKCKATEKECEMLSRLCNEERINRSEVPDVLGKSYRQCFDCGDFDKIKKLKRVGIYSRISALLHSIKKKRNDRNR